MGKRREARRREWDMRRGYGRRKWRGMGEKETVGGEKRIIENSEKKRFEGKGREGKGVKVR